NAGGPRSAPGSPLVGSDICRKFTNGASARRSPKLASDCIGGAQRQRGNSDCGTAASTGWERRSSSDEQVRMIVATTILIDHRCFRIIAHSKGAGRMVRRGNPI